MNIIRIYILYNYGCFLLPLVSKVFFFLNAKKLQLDQNDLK